MNVDQAHDQRVRPATEIARNQAQHQSDQAADYYRRQADEQARPRADHDATEQVATVQVGAQGKARHCVGDPSRGQKAAVEVLLAGWMGCPDQGQKSSGHDEDDQERPEAS